jgi:hypothetical protein
MREFSYPAVFARFRVPKGPRNLAKIIIVNCEDLGFDGDIFLVGRKEGSINGRHILGSADALPRGIDLAVILES